ncbi:dATP/dGTP pyrophosphohydrolase domain-containing protein [Klebsiella pneumoniae]
MTKSTITRERLEWLSQISCRDDIEDIGGDEIRELASMALAAMDTEPVILYRQVNPVNGMKTYWAELDPEEFRHLKQHTDENAEFMTLYRHAQPAPERDQVRSEHAEWSQATFGNVGPVGPLEHLSKEALEAAAEPGDLSEWADMQFLLWDAQRRAGITDEQITQAMIDKLAVNKQRSWPEPKDGEPRLHINEQPALTGNSPIIGIDLASGPDRTVEVRYVAPPGYVMVPNDLIAAANRLLDSDGSRDCYSAMECYDAHKEIESLLAAAPTGIPIISDGWIPVGERMPDENAEQQVLACFKGGDISTLYYFEGRWDDAYGIVPIRQDVTHWMPLPAAPREVQGE